MGQTDAAVGQVLLTGDGAVVVALGEAVRRGGLKWSARSASIGYLAENRRSETPMMAEAVPGR
jgi:hypothetical protein